jgi:hypothetical protein
MSSKAVNRPTDVKQKEADINQKLQLYGIFTGMFRFCVALQPLQSLRRFEAQLEGCLRELD